MQTYFMLKEEAIDLTTSQPALLHDHATLCIHQEMHSEKEKEKKREKKRRKTKKSPRAIPLVSYLTYHSIFPISTPSTPNSTPIPPPIKIKHFFTFFQKEEATGFVVVL